MNYIREKKITKTFLIKGFAPSPTHQDQKAELTRQHEVQLFQKWKGGHFKL